MKDNPRRKQLCEEIRDGDIVVKRSRLIANGSTHSHDYFELIICTSCNGHSVQVINGNEYSFEKDSVLLLCPTDFHSEKISGVIDTIQVHFRENILDDFLLSTFLNYGSDMIFRLDATAAKNLLGITHLLLDEYENAHNYRNEFINNMFNCLMLTFLRNMGIENRNHKSATPMQKALMHLHMHFRENPSLDDIALIANMNRTYFCERFSAYAGTSFVKYVNNLKLSYAKKLLKSTDLPVTEVCFKSGFNSDSNFLRVFKTEYGISPRQYRKSCSGHAERNGV